MLDRARERRCFNEEHVYVCDCGSVCESVCLLFLCCMQYCVYCKYVCCSVCECAMDVCVICVCVYLCVVCL